MYIMFFSIQVCVCVECLIGKQKKPVTVDSLNSRTKNCVNNTS
jgi:hypothetical protein